MRRDPRGKLSRVQDTANNASNECCTIARRARDKRVHLRRGGGGEESCQQPQASRGCRPKSGGLVALRTTGDGLWGVHGYSRSVPALLPAPSLLLARAPSRPPARGPRPPPTTLRCNVDRDAAARPSASSANLLAASNSPSAAPPRLAGRSSLRSARHRALCRPWRIVWLSAFRAALLDARLRSSRLVYSGS